MDNVAYVEQADASDAVKRGDQPRVAQLCLGVFHCSLVAFDLRVELLDGGLLIVELLLRGRVGLYKIAETLEIELRVLEMHLIMFKRGLRLIELRLVSARIDLGEQIPLLDRLTLTEVDADEQPCDLAVNRSRVQSRDRPEAGQDDRHIEPSSR
jgi:hypothetical protein